MTQEEKDAENELTRAQSQLGNTVQQLLQELDDLHARTATTPAAYIKKHLERIANKDAQINAIINYNRVTNEILKLKTIINDMHEIKIAATDKILMSQMTKAETEEEWNRLYMAKIFLRTKV